MANSNDKIHGIRIQTFNEIICLVFSSDSFYIPDTFFHRRRIESYFNVCCVSMVIILMDVSMLDCYVHNGFNLELNVILFIPRSEVGNSIESFYVYTRTTQAVPWIRFDYNQRNYWFSLIVFTKCFNLFGRSFNQPSQHNG